MAQQSPWSVKGVRPECRVAAKVAARRAGVTIGEWLNRAIMDAAKQSVQGSPDTPVSNQLPALPLNELAQAIGALGKHIQKQSERSEEKAGLDRAEIKQTIAPVLQGVRKLEEDFEALGETIQSRGAGGGLDRDEMEETIAPMVKSVRKLEENVGAKFEALDESIQRQEARSRKSAEFERDEIEETMAPMVRSVRRMEENVEAKLDALDESLRNQRSRPMAAGGGVDRGEIEESMAPVLETVRKLEESVEAKFEALDLGDEVGPIQERMREAEAKAERASLSLAPLERKVMRLSQQLEQREPEPIHERPRQQEREREREPQQENHPPRRGLLSRLVGG